jgi:hypothetical protein
MVLYHALPAALTLAASSYNKPTCNVQYMVINKTNDTASDIENE